MLNKKMKEAFKDGDFRQAPHTIQYWETMAQEQLATKGNLQEYMRTYSEISTEMRSLYLPQE